MSLVPSQIAPPNSGAEAGTASLSLPCSPPLSHQAPRWVALVAAVVVALLLPNYGSALLLGVATTTAIFIVLGYAISLFAYLGSFSFGIGGFAAISAYAVAVGDQHHWNMLATEIGALVATGVVSWALAPLFFRLRGIYFALISFAFASLLQQIAVGWTGVTAGTQGLTFLVKAGPVPGVANTPRNVYWTSLVAMLLVAYGVRTFRRSRMGKRAIALGGDVVLARSLGIVPGTYQRRMSAVAGVLGGLAGILYAYSVGFVAPNDFGTQMSLLPVAAVIIGGVRYASAPVIGAVLVVLIPQSANLSPLQYTVVYAVLLIGVILVASDGLVEAALRIGMWAMSTLANRQFFLGSEATASGHLPARLVGLWSKKRLDGSVSAVPGEDRASGERSPE